MIGFSSASQALAVFAVSPFAPQIIRRFGLAATIFLCAGGIVLVLALLPLTNNLYMWFPIRFILGAGICILFVAGETWVSEATAEEFRGRAIGVFGFLWSAGFAAGPLTIGIVGIDGWLPFLVGIGMICVAVTPLVFTARTAPAIVGKPAVGMAASGKIVSGFSMAANLALGADWCNAARAFMFALGCVQSMRCHTNRCPTGVTTNDPVLQRGLVVALKAQRVAGFQRHTVEALAELVAAAGLMHPQDLMPHHIWHRLNPIEVRTLDRIYNFLEPGVLVSAPDMTPYAEEWRAADPDSFEPRMDVGPQREGEGAAQPCNAYPSQRGAAALSRARPHKRGGMTDLLGLMQSSK
jgi:hypothetical protein